jgi:hypothetical protein
LFALISLVSLFTLILSGCGTFRTLFQNPDYVYENGAVLVDGADLPIKLKNNPQAVNVSYKDLLDFVRQDPTDFLPYVERNNPGGQIPFVCSDFAEMLHNNAEAAGIRAGYVSIDWVGGDIGHAVDAFETTDQGLVFIDCTGKSDYSQLEQNEDNVTLGSWDKVAYIVVGYEYGVINITYAKSADYSFYQSFEEQWQELKERLAAYNAEVKLYNQEIRNTVFVEGCPQIARIRAWEQKLTVEE